MSTPFDALEDFIALPRLGGLALSPDGTRLVTGVATLDHDRTAYVTALWELDPTGERPARRLTRGAEGESLGAFLPSGDLLFLTSRRQPGEKDEPTRGLWRLPAGGGEGAPVSTRPGGFAGVTVARTAGLVAALAPTLPGAATEEDDATRRSARRDRKVRAILHTGYPVRHWDHDLGPDENRVLIAEPPAPAAGEAGAAEPPLGWRGLTPAPGRALDEADLAISDDGALVATTWLVPDAGGRRSTVRVTRVDSGRTVLVLGDPDHEYEAPVFAPVAVPTPSPDPAVVAAVATDGPRPAATLLVRMVARARADTPPDTRLGLVDVVLDDDAGGGRADDDRLPSPVGHDAVRLLTPAWDRWPSGARWSPDASRVFVVADDDGACPVFAIDVASGQAVRLSGDRGAYGDLCVSPDGQTLYAVRSAVDSPPQVVRFSADAPWQEPFVLPGPVREPALPGRLEEVTATAEDGTQLRAWLALPAAEGSATDGDGPTPLLVWIHGGPLNSWNAWSWRWNPWLAVARGYAVLLPDPALSTGYGRAFVERGWGRWGEEPYTDVMALTDAALRRPDLDADRTAALGGSFGGYLANWVAGHTDRFRGIVSHAGLWALDQFTGTTDAAHYWRPEMSVMAERYSPHRFVDRIVTPMLVIHGDRDYRVPVGEALRLWSELTERSAADDGTSPHRFLYFPDENHWILAPQHAVVWYETVFAFLAHTVHGEAWEVPDMLR